MPNVGQGVLPFLDGLLVPGGCWEERRDGCVGHSYGRHIAQQPCFSCHLGEMRGLGPGRSGKQKLLPRSLAVTTVFRAFSALTFRFSPS